MNTHEKIIATPPTVCVVCEMGLKDQPTVVSREYQGEVYTFCSEACAEKFMENPETYTEAEEDEADE